MNKAAQAYFQTNVSTTDQGRLLLMLYDGALKFIQQARVKMLAKDFAAKGILISKVIDIINELSSSLNLDKGGSLAENLNNLYLLCTARLLRANLKMDLESLDSVESILSGLRGAYAQIIDTPEARKAASDIAGRMQPAGSVLKKAQPVLQSTMTAVPRAHAQAAYGRNAMNFTTAATAASVTPAAPAGQRAHVQAFDASYIQRPPMSSKLPGAYGKP
ncbi:MAG: flagellar export chaperone FliS [Desulfovibrio sp.]|nr:flagellar export chaperone FliS [Desulfovibrio sp.]